MICEFRPKGPQYDIELPGSLFVYTPNPSDISKRKEEEIRNRGAAISNRMSVNPTNLEPLSHDPRMNNGKNQGGYFITLREAVPWNMSASWSDTNFSFVAVYLSSN